MNDSSDSSKPARTLESGPIRATSPGPLAGVPPSGPEWRLFLRRWIANPLRTGAALPSSRALADLVARHIPDPAQRLVVELGAGTGAISAALARRVPQEQLILVEVDAELCAWLRRRLPRATVLYGDAADLSGLLNGHGGPGDVACVVSGVPVLQFPLAAQRAFVDQCFAAMGPGGVLLQYSYMPVSPLPCARLGLRPKRIGATFASMPPVFLWRFARQG